MVREFRYNTYGPGRTRPMRREEAHWRDLGVRVGMQMRKPPMDPGHRLPPGMRFKMGRLYTQGKQAKAAFLTPHPPG